MPVLCGAVAVNLERRPDRRAAVTQLLESLHLPHFQVLKATDGRQLEKSGGRCRRDTEGSRGCWRLSWSEGKGASTVRRFADLKAGKLCKAAFVDPWSHLGNRESHIRAVLYAQSQGWQTVLVLEDDAALQGLSGREAGRIAREAVSLLNSKRPGWCLLMLGGQCINGFRAPKTGNGRVGLGPSVCAAECVYQSHSYILSAAGMEQMLLIWQQQSFGADAGLAHLQITTWRAVPTAQSVKGKCFRVNPFVCFQTNGEDSDLVFFPQKYTKMFKKLGQGKRGSVPKSRRRVRGRFGRGVCRITKAARSSAQRHNGKLGGMVRAGGGRSAAAARKFRAWMWSQYGKMGAFPPYTGAYAKHKCSRYLYCSVTKLRRK